MRIIEAASREKNESPYYDPIMWLGAWYFDSDGMIESAKKNAFAEARFKVLYQLVERPTLRRPLLRLIYPGNNVTVGKKISIKRDYVVSWTDDKKMLGQIADEIGGSESEDGMMILRAEGLPVLSTPDWIDAVLRKLRRLKDLEDVARRRMKDIQPYWQREYLVRGDKMPKVEVIGRLVYDYKKRRWVARKE